MSIKFHSHYSQKLTEKELNFCKKGMKSSKIPTAILQLNEKIKSLETHCQQFKKLHIEWKTLNNQINQKMKNISPGRSLSEKTENAPGSSKKERSFSPLPYAGLSLGAITGLIQRFVSSKALDFKDKELAKKLFKEIPLLQEINRFKQNEIKNFSLLMPLLPLALQIVQDTWNGPKDKKMLARLKDAIKDHSYLEQGIYLTAALAGMAGAACYPKEYAEKYFDPSGHIMLKTLLTTLSVKTLSAALEKNQNSSFVLGSSALYAVQTMTDAVFIHTTVSVCHTIPELAVGFTAALMISAIAKKAIKRLQPSKP